MAVQETAQRNLALGEFIPEKKGKSRGGGRLLRLSLQIAVLIVVLGLWQLLSGRVVASFLVSNPVDVVKKLVDLLQTRLMWQDISTTSQELVIGYAIGVVSGVAVGLLLGAVRFAGTVFEPLINAVNGIPKIALAPLFLLWFGLGIWSKVVQAVLIVFFVMFYNVYMGMRSVPKPLSDVLTVMGASRSYLIRKIVVPSMSGPIFAGLKAGVPFAMIGVIVGEFIASDQGVGYYVLFATQQYDAAGLFAGIAIMVVMILIGVTIVSTFERRVMRWQHY